MFKKMRGGGDPAVIAGHFYQQRDFSGKTYAELASCLGAEKIVQNDGQTQQCD
jgi:hypothetical protein